ncbi:hypothetical protein FOG48_00589 [Hanseniaspora uvarum]|nr:hypothetical protein FOG48_00589 [Hanseniaspora uvarum]
MEEKLQRLCLDLRCGNITSKVFIKELFSIYNVKSLHDLKPLLKQDDSEVFMILETILLQSEEPVLNNEDIEGEDEGDFEEDIDDKYNAAEHKLKNLDIFSDDVFYPPENFSHVIGNIYRSSFPRAENIPFFKQHLKLKSILVMLSDEYPEELLDLYGKHEIKLFTCAIQGNKEPFINIQDETINKALRIILNPENHPILIHCNKGKHRTGTIVGCIRKLQKWSLTMIFDEYRRFAFPKARGLDQQCIEMFNSEEIEQYALKRNWLPLNW